MYFWSSVKTASAVAILLFFSSAVLSSQAPYRRSFINPYPRFKAYQSYGDPGEPLYLTPLIEKNETETARNLSKVVGTQYHGVESYAGYLTVDKHYNSNMFFWYFPATDARAYAPVVLWLQGGPGASSLFGLFMENGPFQFDGEKIKLREYSWHKKHNLIYIDNPVGTGFSFTDNDSGYARNERQVAESLYTAVKQLLQLFDFSLTHGFWITGESYAGKYVPALALYIDNHKSKTDIHIPLKGIAIGNGLSDPLHQLNYGAYLYQLGLVDSKGLALFQAAEEKGIKLIHEHKMDEAFEVFDELINMDETSNGSLFRNLTGYNAYFNYLKTTSDNSTILGEFLQSPLTRRSIHVGNKTFHDLDTENKVEQFLKADIMDSVAPWVAKLLDTYTVCIYNGQLDIIVAYPLTENYLSKLQFEHSDIYKNAEREIWRVDGEIAGYKKRGGNLIEVLVRNAGHMSPMDQPKWVYDLITTITGTNNNTQLT